MEAGEGAAVGHQEDRAGHGRTVPAAAAIRPRNSGGVGDAASKSLRPLARRRCAMRIASGVALRRGRDRRERRSHDIAGALTLPADVAAAAEPASASTESSDDGAEGSFRTRSPYLHVAPFGIGSHGEPALFWGLGGGIMVPRGRRALVTVGGFAEHVLFLGDRLFPGERQIQLFRSGPEVRIGGGRRVSGYGLLGVDLPADRVGHRPDTPQGPRAIAAT